MDLNSLHIEGPALVSIAIVAGLYILVVTVFGGYFSRYNNTINDYFYSGQRFSWWLPAVSMVATGVGSYSFLKYSEQGLKVGMSSSITYLNDWFIIPFFLFGWLPIIYYARIKSIPEYFERRFNKTARLLALVIILAYMFFYIGYNLYTAGLVIEGLFGLSQIISVPLIALFLSGYVTFGGQTAVIFTDFFQGIMLFIGGSVALIAGVTALGGLDQFWSYLPITHKLPFVHLIENKDFNTTGLFWGEALIGSVAFAFLNQGFIMRYLTIKSIHDCRKAAFFNLIFTMPICALLVGAMGWVAKAIVTKQSQMGGALAGYDFLNITDTSQTFLVVCWVVIQKNPWIFGLIIASLLAALMSTIDTLINACAAIIIYDIYQPYIKNEASNEHNLKVAKIASVLSTFVGLSLVIIFNIQKDGHQSLMALHYKGLMVIIPSIVTTVFMGVFWVRFHAKPACLAMFFGASLTLSTVWFPEFIDPIAWFISGQIQDEYIYMNAVFGALVTVLIGVFFTFVLKAPIKQELGLTIYSLHEAKQKYKNNLRLNETEGKTVRGLSLEIDNTLTEGQILVPQKYMELMSALSGDMVYISDNRKILGGLRAGHVLATGLKGNGVNDSIRISTSTLNQCYLNKNKSVLLEKVL